MQNFASSMMMPVTAGIDLWKDSKPDNLEVQQGVIP